MSASEGVQAALNDRDEAHYRRAAGAGTGLSASSFITVTSAPSPLPPAARLIRGGRPCHGAAPGPNLLQIRVFASTLVKPGNKPVEPLVCAATKQTIGFAFSLDPPLIQKQDSARHVACECHFMGDDEHGSALRR